MHTRSYIPILVLSLAMLGGCDRQKAEVISPDRSIPIVTRTRNILFEHIARNEISQVPATSENAAAFVISGRSEGQIQITVPEFAEIHSLYGGAGALNARLDRPSIRVNTTNSVTSASVLDISSGTATATLSSDGNGDGVNEDGKGQLYIWIGGTATGGPFLPEGAYGGNVTIAAVSRP